MEAQHNPGAPSGIFEGTDEWLKILGFEGLFDVAAPCDCEIFVACNSFIFLHNFHITNVVPREGYNRHAAETNAI
jgi:hypothetical protein